MEKHIQTPLEIFELTDKEREAVRRAMGVAASNGLVFFERTDPVGNWSVDFDKDGNPESRYAL